MHFEEYETRYHMRYGEFAAVVSTILEKALLSTKRAARPQSVQHRAKSPEKLRDKLEKRGLLASSNIESQIRDLAGVRLIFYTNTDVNRFLHSRIIPETFDVCWESTRIHHPADGSSDQGYRAIHYTVSLSSQRTELPEYQQFCGMLCEIQIQTVLNHAWAETAHDILYKPQLTVGFGTDAMRSIDKRMKRIMDDYLLPAGYEFQKVQHDFERLVQGRALFDRGIFAALDSCLTNNDRYDVLRQLHEYVLPNYDEIEAIYSELLEVLIASLEAARAAVAEEVNTPFGNLAGKTSKDISQITLDIVDDFRYVDVCGTFSSLLHMYRKEDDPAQRRAIVRICKRLAEYNLAVWEKVGPGVQLALTDLIDRLSSEDRADFSAILSTVWFEFLSPELRSNTVSEDQFIIRSAAMGVADGIAHTRAKAIAGALSEFDRATSEGNMADALLPLWEATRLPFQTNFSNGLCALVIADTKLIVESLTAAVDRIPYQLLAHIEHQLMLLYQRWHEVVKATEDKFQCRDVADSLCRTLAIFRDKVNVRQQFVRYKTLVGYDTVFPSDWDQPAQDYLRTESTRKRCVEDYIAEIDDESKGDWFDLLALCAATKSNDLATFPLFCQFLEKLSETKPLIAMYFMARGNPDLSVFLPAFLSGLSRSSARDDYVRIVNGHLENGTHLAAIARHWHTARPKDFNFLERLLSEAISVDDDIAVIECVVAITVTNGSAGIASTDPVFERAMKYLTRRGDVRWIRGVWFRPEAKSFFGGMSAGQADVVFDNLIFAKRIDHEVEKILALLSAGRSERAWRFFAQRIAAGRQPSAEAAFQAVPYQLRELKAPLADDIQQAILSVRSLFAPNDPLFEFGGATLLSAVFPGCPEPFARELSRLAEDGSDDDLDFIISVMRKYRGETGVHNVLRKVVARLPENDRRLERVEICLEATGVVQGLFGFVEAFKAKKREMTVWLEHNDQRVQKFGNAFIGRLEQRIAFEQRSADERGALRRLSHETTKSNGESDGEQA